MNTIRLPASAWAQVWRRTLVVAILSALASVGLSEIVMQILSQGMNLAGVIAAAILPILLGGPMLLYFQIQSARLRDANRRLETLASTDSLTNCLNRRAFTGRVVRCLDQTSGSGALLVIDADNFKTVNDRFGHDRGDEVLQMIAQAIRQSVRDTDLVGRIGGEEFGVFLPGAGFESAHHAAERIRAAVNALFVTSDGLVQRLSVSIGGAVCAGEVSFAELFRVADRRLYSAKNGGRNRVKLGGSIDDAAVARLASGLAER